MRWPGPEKVISVWMKNPSFYSLLREYGIEFILCQGIVFGL